MKNENNITLHLPYFLGLYSADGEEIVAPDYKRIELNKDDFSSNGNNIKEIQFSETNTDWGWVDGVILFDATGFEIGRSQFSNRIARYMPSETTLKFLKDDLEIDLMSDRWFSDNILYK